MDSRSGVASSGASPDPDPKETRREVGFSHFSKRVQPITVPPMDDRTSWSMPTQKAELSKYVIVDGHHDITPID